MDKQGDTSMALTRKEIAKKLNKTYQEFMDWCESSFEEDWIITEGSAYEKPICVYTDGDSGVAVLECSSEIFEEFGLTLRSVEDLAWCDIHIRNFICILEEMETVNGEWLHFIENFDYDAEEAA
jgi:hypothetical protein